jgi:hypothetical protein
MAIRLARRKAGNGEKLAAKLWTANSKVVKGSNAIGCLQHCRDCGKSVSFKAIVCVYERLSPGVLLLAYTYGDYWPVADSLSNFLGKFKTQQETALFGGKNVV